jgi:hypothetical protein
LRRTRRIFFGPLHLWSAKVPRRTACSDRLAQFNVQYTSRRCIVHTSD